MFRVAGLVGVLIIVSKIFGLIRDLVIANYFGTSMTADAFNMAYLFTGNFFILFGGIGGPFYSSVVAVLPKLQEKDPQAVREFIKSILVKSSLVLVFVTAAIFFFRAYIVGFFIDPITKPEYFKATLFQLDFLLPLVLICGPIGILAGILNVYKKYYAPSLAPAVLNFILIITILIMGDAYNGLALALGTSIGALFSLAIQFPAWFEARKKLKEAIDHSKTSLEKIATDLKFAKDKYGEILYPALLGTGISQALVYVDGYFSDAIGEGAWTSLVMGNRLVQMPLGVLLTAFLVPLFPRLSELATNNNYDEMKAQLKRAFRVLMLICVPGTLVGLFFAEPIIRLIFERGAFDASSTAMVSTVFFWLCLTIIPYIYRDTVTRVFYSIGDSRTPMYVALLAVILKVFLNIWLIPIYGLAGIPIATVAIIIFNFLLLSLLLKRKIGRFLCFTI